MNIEEAINSKFVNAYVVVSNRDAQYGYAPLYGDEDLIIKVDDFKVYTQKHIYLRKRNNIDYKIYIKETTNTNPPLLLDSAWVMGLKI